MNEPLTDFLIDVASDPDVMARFMANPTAELERSRLSVHERAVVRGGDSAAIRQALGAKDPGTRINKKKKKKKKAGKKR